MPETLIEAELFGYAEGAFTGARKGGSRGLVRDADHGTLFLDEIGDMPISLQPVLLRFLDDWTARPIGGENYTVDILLVSATNARLDEFIANGRFRSDLLYRLNALDVSLPSLNDRGDFAAIARHVLARIDPKLKISEEFDRMLGHAAVAREHPRIAKRSRATESVDNRQRGAILPARRSEPAHRQAGER